MEPSSQSCQQPGLAAGDCISTGLTFVSELLLHSGFATSAVEMAAGQSCTSFLQFLCMIIQAVRALGLASHFVVSFIDQKYVRVVEAGNMVDPLLLAV